MKISPIASPSQVAVNPNEGQSANASKIAAAKAIVNGQEPAQAKPQQTNADPQVERAQQSIKRIKMRVNRNTTVIAPKEAAVESTTAPVTQQNNVLDNTEQTKPASEAIDPGSPQFAALAKAKRALQAKEREIATREAALLNQPSAQTGDFYTKEQVRANALKVLRESGVTNDELTEAILQEAQDYGPGFNKLESEVKAIKQAFENQEKKFTEQEAGVERQVLTQIRKDVDHLVANGDVYEAVRETGHAPKVVELIHRTFKQTGEYLDTSEAAQLVNDQIIEDSLKFARLKSVQSRLAPQAPTAQQTPVEQNRPNTKTMRTLTNRDGSSSISMSKRERAIAAAEGRLK